MSSPSGWGCPQRGLAAPAQGGKLSTSGPGARPRRRVQLAERKFRHERLITIKYSHGTLGYELIRSRAAGLGRAGQDPAFDGKRRDAGRKRAVTQGAPPLRGPCVGTAGTPPHRAKKRGFGGLGETEARQGSHPGGAG